MSLIPQFGTSFATFRPALSHSGSTRPLSVILPVPASPPYNRPPGSSSSSPTSKVPIWKVCSPFASTSSVAHFLLFPFNTFQVMHYFHHLINSFITTLLCFPHVFTKLAVCACICLHFLIFGLPSLIHWFGNLMVVKTRQGMESSPIKLIHVKHTQRVKLPLPTYTHAPSFARDTAPPLSALR